MSVIDLFKSLSDQSRLNIINLLLKEDMYVELIAKTLKLSPSTVSFHLKKLEKSEVVRSYKDQYYMMYQINKEILNQTLKNMVTEEKIEENIKDQRIDEYRQKVLDTFFKGPRLTQIPVQRKKKRIVLEEMAKNFEIGKEYKEPTVNHMIKKHHEDFCTIRREFIMEKLFTRDSGIYKRVK